MTKKIVVATKKPFHPVAVQKIKEACDKKGYEFKLFEKYNTQEELMDAIKDANGIIIRSDKITEEVINNCQNLEVVVRGGAGYDNVDCDAAKKKNVVVMNTPGQNSNAVAELAFGMMVFMARNKYNGKPGTELKEKTIGIHAYGNVGQNVARIAKGFGMKVIAFDPFVSSEAIKADGVKPLESVEELYSNADYISVHIPSIPQTQKFIGKTLINSMKKNAAIINTARKEVINDEELIEVFSKREDLLFASDIAPVIKDEMIEKFGDRVFFTPKKMGAQTAEANINAGVAGINQIIALFDEDDRTFQVNK
ncbi:MAG: NAD(P)-dependent oxidoreductase [Candidatus Cloacimonadota bacterium]|nr:NAD(P)-dependent oxidoreductase [Candidatus Cloacimonadota bacterium]